MTHYRQANILEDGSVQKVAGKLVSIQCGRCDNELEVLAASADALEQAKEHVCVDGALVRLIQDDD